MESQTRFSITEILQHDILGGINNCNVVIGAVLLWKERIFRLQLQFKSLCYVRIKYCNATPFLYRILSFQNIICNDFVPNGNGFLYTSFGIPGTCYRTEKAQIPKSAGESAGRVSGKGGLLGGLLGGGFLWKSRETALLPAVSRHSSQHSPRHFWGFGLSQQFGRRGHWKRGICTKLSEIDFQIRDKVATILRTLPLMYETRNRQFCANLARNLRQICATPPPP